MNMHMFGAIVHKSQAKHPPRREKKAIFCDIYHKIQNTGTRILQFVVSRGRIALHQVSGEVMKRFDVIFLYSNVGHKTQETNKIRLTHFREDIPLDLSFPK